MKLKYIPNVITCLRSLLIIPLLIALLSSHFTLAFYLFLIAGISDALDGYLARRFKWHTPFGALADPIADKLLLVGVFISLTVLGFIPGWWLAIIVGRDLWVLSGAITYHYVIGPFVTSPHWTGKLNTVLQIVLVALLLLDKGLLPLPKQSIEAVMFVVLLTTIISALDYTWVWGKKALIYRGR